MWYAQYRKADKVITGAGFVDPQTFVSDECDVTIGFDGEIPILRDDTVKPAKHLYRYDAVKQCIELIPDDPPVVITP